ncbi:RagB/SusD family nutrient uptake outer membrane protein [Rufibacter psychrotolerans]|uniref:RagB/SusD family nutrient uptake outer membrane protein n=1 Tax=Rufibacter psychrotolerans TaxID=2812556 RepID=UPI0019679D95|nr:RagB/SusD family nutrient uptake outer membrane protein [Rufibacter sp. SYSU D00308]
MNKKYYYIMGAALLLSLSGCEDFLTHDHPTSVTDEVWWNTEADATAALASVYVGIPHGATGRQVQFLSALSDDAVARQSTRGDYEAYVKGLQGPSFDKSLHIWQDNYKTIRRAARFLDHVDKVYMDESLKARYKYEARALRAYYHLELLMLFGGVPIVTSAVTPNESALPRNTKEEVYEFVVSELTAAANNLPAEYSFNDRTRITSGICWALISRLALFHHKYDDARMAARKIIDSNLYELYESVDKKNSYADLFTYTGELNKERIFYRESGSSGAWNTFAPKGIGGETVVSPTAAIVNSFETKQGKTIWELGPDSAAIYQRDPTYKNNRDPRLAASVLLPGQEYDTNVLDPFNSDPKNADRIGDQYSTATGFWINKYLDPKDRNGSRTLDYMIIRYAEVLLNYVEALVEEGEWNHPDVLKYLNAIRNRAGMPDVDVAAYNSQEKMRELVRRERQVELAFEAVRYFDIRRWGIFEAVMNGPVYGAVHPETEQAILVEQRTARANRDYYWPIPQNEIMANPNMEQNPNY